MDIGLNLYELRKNVALDAQQLADMIGISKSYVHKLEKNQSEPGLAIAQRWVACTRPDPSSPNYDVQKTEKWVKISLTFLFDDGFLNEGDDSVIPVAEQELQVKSVPKILTRFLPAHYLHSLYKTFFCKD